MILDANVEIWNLILLEFNFYVYMRKMLRFD